jgi:thiol-disulfide isomerase/thioredoxin
LHHRKHRIDEELIEQHNVEQQGILHDGPYHGSNFLRRQESDRFLLRVRAGQSQVAYHGRSRLNDAIALGPLLLPFSLLLVLASLGVTIFVGNRFAKGAGIDLEVVLWRTLLVGLLAARVTFVLEYRSLYFASPLSILDIRDGGWNAPFGLMAAWLYALHRQRRDPSLGKPLRWALATGTAVFVVGTAFLALGPQTGQPLPNLAFSSLDGRTVPLDHFRGKPIVVNLWATWCPPCVREMPVLRKAQVERQDVHFVFLNQGEDPVTVNRWLQAQGLPLQNVLIDELRQASAAFRQQGYPTTLFFDAEGSLVSRRIGELSAATLNEKLRQFP